MYSITTNITLSPAAFPNPDEVEALMKNFLRSPVHVLTEIFFRAPIFAVCTVREVAGLYRCTTAEAAVLDSHYLKYQNKSNANIKIHVWFADLLDCDWDTVLATVEIC